MEEEDSRQQQFSWTVIDSQRLSKEIDRSVILYKMTGIPVEIRWFFNLDQLVPGERLKAILHYKGKGYEVLFSMGRQNPPRTRLTWRTDFAQIIERDFKIFNKQKKEYYVEPLEVGQIIFEKKSYSEYKVFFQ